MAEKRERQGGCSSNAPEAGADRSLYLTEVVCAEIGQFPPFDVAPYEFGRIEIGRVAGQAFNGQPRALRLQVRRHGAAPMRWQAIPDEDETPTTKVPLELVQEARRHPVRVHAIGEADEIGLITLRRVESAFASTTADPPDKGTLRLGSVDALR